MIGGRARFTRGGGRGAEGRGSGGRRSGRRRMWSGSLQSARGLRSRRKGRVRRILLILAGTAALGVVVQLAATAAELAAESRLLRVRRVSVRGNDYLSDEAIVRQLGDLSGRSLIDIHPRELEARLLAHPRLRSAKVGRAFDRRLVIDVVERRPVALLAAGVLVEVDSEGVVLPPVERGALPDLPVLVGTNLSLPAPGSRIKSPVVKAALDLVDDLGQSDPDLLAEVSQIDLSRSPVVRLSLVGRPAVLVVHAGSLSPAKLAGVRSVLEDLERRGRRDVEVDLRFEGQLVVRELNSGRPRRAPRRWRKWPRAG